MPELPEVETVTRDLRAKIKETQILGVETDWPKLFKGPNFLEYRQQVKNQKIISVERRAKNILIGLSGGKTMLIHLKMTGHLLITRDAVNILDGRWVVDKDSPLSDPFNQYIHVVWQLSGDVKMALSDLRKFANITLLDAKELEDKLSIYGPEPLSNDFRIECFTEVIKKSKKEIKAILLDQGVVAGIGNIYADEILFASKISPLRRANSLTKKEINVLYQCIKEVLLLALSLRGTSISDYRDTEGKKGGYAEIRKVYKREKSICPNACGGHVKRIKLVGRGTYYCPECQK
jgi:formamidopyrimidine-DNA glycosylase